MLPAVYVCLFTEKQFHPPVGEILHAHGVHLARFHRPLTRSPRSAAVYVKGFEGGKRVTELVRQNIHVAGRTVEI